MKYFLKKNSERLGETQEGVRSARAERGCEPHGRGKWENEKMRELGNEEMGGEVVLEAWGCASEIKQNLNKIKATPCEMQEKRQAVVARRAVMEFSDDSSLSDGSKTR